MSGTGGYKNEYSKKSKNEHAVIDNELFVVPQIRSAP